MTLPIEQTSLRHTMPEDVWRAQAAQHAERADELTAARRQRLVRGDTDPVEDFLFTYYSYRPSLLRRWHPGAGVLLEGRDEERLGWKWYREVDGGIAVDIAGYLRQRTEALGYIIKLLKLTAARTARYGCFGLHEWAMVYRLSEGELRHRQLSLRLGAEATDAVVEGHSINCSHFDAFRFFTPEARPMNALQPSRETQLKLEQPGCLHAGMDLYKWAVKLGPLVPGELLLETFELARDIRVVDMRASPYDLREQGLEAIRIEEPEGKQQYASLQRGFSERAAVLRTGLLAALDLAQRSV